MTASKQNTGTDWAKADAYVNTPEDYEELPELDDDFFERAKLEIDGKPVRGQPLKDKQRADTVDRSALRQGDPVAVKRRREPS